MTQLRFVVDADYEGATLKGFLRSKCSVSARMLAKLKRTSNGLLVNGKEVFATAVLHRGDRVALTLPDSVNTLAPSPVPVPVLWEDAHLVVFNKPPHMAVHPSPGNGEDTLANVARTYAEQQGEHWAFRPVNRLDKDTSGLVVVAKDGFAAAKLAGTVYKTYVAVCEGQLSGEGMIDAPIRLKAGHSIQRETGEGGLPAVTQWRAIASAQGHTLLGLCLQTGRTHQIRVHMASFGHPLAGDDLYGGSRELISRQALHCNLVKFFHPVSGEAYTVRAPLSKDFDLLCRRLFLEKDSLFYR